MRVIPEEELEAAMGAGFKVSLVVGKADHFRDHGRLSRFYDYKPAYQVTEGRAGGAKREDGLYPGVEEWVA